MPADTSLVYNHRKIQQLVHNRDSDSEYDVIKDTKH